MSNETCLHETAVLAAHCSGEWEESLASHVESCPSCSEAVRMAGWMHSLSGTTLQHRPLPDPDLLWIKSRLFAREAAAERAAGPLYWGDTLARAIVGAFAAAWLALNWPKMQAYLVGLWEESGADLVQVSANPWPLTLASVVVAVGLAALVLAVHPLLTRN
jgi:hypothetical protein